MDVEFEDRRNRERGDYLYLFLDAQYEKLTQNSKVSNVAVLTAVGIDRKGNHRNLGLFVAPSEGEIH